MQNDIFITKREKYMADIILLEIEEDIRLAAQIVAKRRGIDLKVYADYSDYKNNMQKYNIVCSSNMAECKEHNFCYIKKPYTAHELLELIGRVRQ